MLCEALSDYLNSELEGVYSEIGESDRQYADRAWRKSCCDLWTLAAQKHVIKLLGEKALIKNIAYNPTGETARMRSIPFGFHAYILKCDAQTPVVIDGTWQQFAPLDTCIEAPKVLVAPANKTPDFLEHYGVDPKWWIKWRPDIAPPDVFFDFDV